MYDILGAVMEVLVYTADHMPWGRRGCLITLLAVFLVCIAALLMMTNKATPQ